jgi:protein-L-isoaspartate(D-aspartate) O-methyltransferase
MTPWSDLYLWLAGFAPGFCRLDQTDDPQLAGGGPVMRTGWYPFAIAHDGTLCYLTVRDLPDGSGVEFGALAYGHCATEAAAALVGHLHAWDARGRNLPEDAFTYWPNGTAPPLPDRLLSVFRRRRGSATITWPAERPAGTLAGVNSATSEGGLPGERLLVPAPSAKPEASTGGNTRS